MNQFPKWLLHRVFFPLTLVMLTNLGAISGELHASVVNFEPGAVPRDRTAECMVTNVGSSTREVGVQITSLPETMVPLLTVTLEPGEISGLVVDISPAFSVLAYCSFYFSGSNSDMRGIIRAVDRSTGEAIVLERAEAR